jgi:hypothetical protein
MKDQIETYYIIQCECGNIGEVPKSALLSGEITACHVCSGEIKQPFCDDCRRNNNKGIDDSESLYQVMSFKITKGEEKY